MIKYINMLLYTVAIHIMAFLSHCVALRCLALHCDASSLLLKWE